MWSSHPHYTHEETEVQKVATVPRRKCSSLSHVQLFGTPWTVADQVSLSMGFSRQEYWSGLPCPFPGDLPNPRIEPRSPTCRQILYRLNHQGSPYTGIHTSYCMHAQSLSCIQFFVIPWTVACQAPLSIGSSRQEYWSGLPFSPPRNLPNPGIEPVSPALQADSLPLSHQYQHVEVNTNTNVSK